MSAVVADMRTRDQVKSVIERAFRERFPTDTVDISDGYQGNIHLLVVSRQFDDLSEPDKQDFMWQVIDGTDLTDDEKALISLVMPLSPSEIK